MFFLVHNVLNIQHSVSRVIVIGIAENRVESNSATEFQLTFHLIIMFFELDITIYGFEGLSYSIIEFSSNVTKWCDSSTT